MTFAIPAPLRWAILVLGLSGIVAQTVLLRELLILFAGNEFSIGVIIGAWILAEAGGAFAAGRMVLRGWLPWRPFFTLTLLFCVMFPATVAATRTYKLLAGLPPDQGVGIGSVCAASFLLQLPTAFVHGALFVLACAVLARATSNPAQASGRVYSLETVGTIVGGLLAGYLIVPHTSALLAAALVALLNGGVLIWLARRQLPADRPQRPLAAPACLGLAAVLLAGAPAIDQATIHRQWQGRTLAGYHNSPYQNLAVVRSDSQLTFYGDGLPLFSVPDPDIAMVEEFAHLTLLSHPAPQRVLVLGGGAGGVIAEILKHPSVRQVDYVELDPWLLQTVASYAPPASLAFLDDPRVKLHQRDMRQFLRESTEHYDAILLGMPLPVTLQGNRLYTAEFFTLAKMALSGDGLLALTATGSLTYYGPELRAVNSSLLQTLAAVFPAVHVIPGDSNLFLVTPAAGGIQADVGLLSERLEERQLATRLITREHLAYLLDPGQQEWFFANAAGAGEINHDFTPRLLFDHLAYSTLLFTPQLREVFARLRELALLPLVIGITLAGAGGGLLARRTPAIAGPLVIAVTGFTAMLLELVLFCAFQILYGAMFQAVALLISAFMAGLAGGSWLVTTGPLSARPDRQLFVAVEGALLIFCGLLYLLFTLPALPMEGALRAHLLVLPLLIATGLLTGMQFPVASRLQQAFATRAAGVTTTGEVGTIFSADLIGGCLGGLLGGVVLLPVLGLAGSCLLAMSAKFGSLLLFSLSRKTARI